jgi:hypothetical protein
MPRSFYAGKMLGLNYQSCTVLPQFRRIFFIFSFFILSGIFYWRQAVGIMPARLVVFIGKLRNTCVTRRYLQAFSGISESAAVVTPLHNRIYSGRVTQPDSIQKREIHETGFPLRQNSHSSLDKFFSSAMPCLLRSGKSLSGNEL